VRHIRNKISIYGVRRGCLWDRDITKAGFPGTKLSGGCAKQLLQLTDLSGLGTEFLKLLFADLLLSPIACPGYLPHFASSCLNNKDKPQDKHQDSNKYRQDPANKGNPTQDKLGHC